MAFSAGEIEAILQLRDQMSKQLKTASGNMAKFGQSLTKIGPIASQAGIGLTAGLTVPIVAIGAAAVTAFATFEKEMNKVRAISGAAGDDFKSLEDKAKELGATTVFSASQSAEAMSSFALAGFETNEIIEVMAGTLDLAAAATLEVGEAASITAKVLRGYGLATEETARVTDVLTKAFTTSNTDLTSLGTAFKFVGPIARSAGIEFEETAAALSLMADAGFQGTLGGTALRGAIARLLSPTKQASKIMLEMGLNVTTATGKLLPLDQIIQQLEPHAENTGAIMELFGLRAGPAMAALINQGSDALRDQTAALKDAGGTAKKIAEVQLKGLAGAFTLFKSAAEGAFISIGEQLAPTLLKLLDGLTKFAKFMQNTVVPAFTALPQPVQTAALAIVAFLAALGPVLLVFGTLASSVGSLIALFGTVSAGVSAGMAAMSVSVVGLMAVLGPLAIAVGVAVAAFALFKFLEKVGVIDAVSEAIDRLILKMKGLSDAEIDVVRATRGLVDPMSDAATFSAALDDELSEAVGLAGSMKELKTAFDDFNQTGRTTVESMRMIAERALELNKTSGEELSPTMQALIDQLETMDEAARQAADGFDVNTEATAEAAAAAAELKEAAAELGRELTDAGLAGDVAALEMAWRALTPAQQANEQVMRRAADVIQELGDRGAELSSEFEELAIRVRIAESSLLGFIPLVNTGALEMDRLKRFATGSAAALGKNADGTLKASSVLPAFIGLVNTAALEMDQLRRVADPPGGFFSGFLDSFKSVMEGLTGGQGLKGFFQNLGSGIVEGFGQIISGGITSAIDVALGLALNGLSKLGGFFRGLFGGPDAAEREARDIVRVFEDTIIDALDAGQLSQATGERWRQVVIGVRDAFIETGRSAEEGEVLVGQLWDAIRQGGPDAVAAIIAQIQPILDEADAIDALFLTTTQGLDELLAEAARTGELMPGTLEPYLATLEELGADSGLLAVIRGLMGELTTETQVDWKAMEAAAKTYGIELGGLGSAFDQAKLTDAATTLMADFNLLTEAGADVGTVLTGMKDEINKMVLEAIRAGIDLPAGMQPIIAHLIDQGLLVDENGMKLTSMAGLNFAEPMVDKFQQIIDMLRELIDRLLGTIGTVEDLGRSIDDIPDKTVRIDFDVEDLDLPDLPDGFGITEGGVESLGRGGRVTRPTLALLGERGPETVIPDSDLPLLGGGGDPMTVMVNISTVDATGFDRLVEMELIPRLTRAWQDNRRGSRTGARESLGI